MDDLAQKVDISALWNLREEIAARFNYDTGAILKYAQECDAAGDRKVIRLSSRRPITAAPKPRETAGATSKQS